jgi:hypothetical protein
MIRVQIIDREHPHFSEHGELTGEMIRLITGTEMAKMKLDNCPHGNEACYVTQGQVAQELALPAKRARRK